MQTRRSVLALAGAAVITPALAAAAPTFTSQRLSVVVRGHGPDIVLIPGLGCSRAVWDGLAGRLEGHYRLHLVQIAGFAGEVAGANGAGPVTTPVAAELIRYITGAGLKRPTVIGHSLGGFLGLTLARDHGERLGRVLIVDALPFYSLLFSPAATVAMVRPQAAAMRDRLIAMTPEAFAANAGPGMTRLALTPEARAKGAAWMQASDRAVVAQATYEIMTTDLRPDLPRIATPLDLFYPYDPSMGFGSEVVDQLYRGAYQRTPNLVMRRIDGAYHFLMLDQPKVFTEAIEGALARKV